MKNFISLLLCYLMVTPTFANEAKNAALVKMMRGKVEVTDPGSDKPRVIKEGEWIKEGAKVKTAEKSFVKLTFIDKSEMSVGPNSEMGIEKFNQSEPGMINMIKGKLQSEVSKDYLNIKPDQSKLFIKSKQAVMGIRGTAFTVAYNPDAGSNGAFSVAMTEGKVMIAKLDSQIGDAQSLDKLLNEKGAASVQGHSMIVKDEKIISFKLPASQLIKFSEGAIEKEVTSIQNNKVSGSIAPPGLSTASVASNSEALNQEIKQNVSSDALNQVAQETKIAPEVSQPINPNVVVQELPPGTAIAIDVGVAIPPSKESYFDEKSGTFMDPNVKVLDSGAIVLEGGIKITEAGLVKTAADGSTIALGDPTMLATVGGATGEVKLDFKALQNATAPIMPMSGVQEGPKPASLPIGPAPTTSTQPQAPTGALDPTFNQLGIGGVTQDLLYKDGINNAVQQNNTTLPGSTNVQINIKSN